MRIVRVAAVCALAGAVVLGPAGPAAAVPDQERYSVTPTGWGWYYTADAPTINGWAGANNMRIIDVEVLSPTVFSVAMVHNSGSYQRGLVAAASWTFGQTAATLRPHLYAGKRLLDVERYSDGAGGTLYAAAFVDNPPANFHNTIRFNGGPAAITNQINVCGCRITDIDYLGPGWYEVLLMPNVGVDAKTWWWYFGKTAGEVNTPLERNHARLVDVEPEGNGRFTVVMVASNGEYWGWLAAATQAEINDSLTQSGMRVIHIKRHQHVTGSPARYAVIFLDNLAGVSGLARSWAADSAEFPLSVGVSG